MIQQQTNDSLGRLSREVWAGRIREAYGQTVEAVFQVGRELIQAKKELPHGEFMVMVGKELPFSVDAAERFMAISQSPNFNNPNNVRNLPNSWGTLYQLRRLDPAAFAAAVDAGKIHPEMTRADAEALLPPKRLAPVVPMSAAQRASLDAAMQEGGRLIAEYVEQEAALDRTVEELGDRLQPSSATRAAEAVADEVLALLRTAYARLQATNPKPRFDHRWGEAARLARHIRTYLEGLT